MIQKTPVKNLAASVRHRLLNLARERNEVFDLILVRYATERFLYRLSQSKYRDQFILKGAMLFILWADEPHRPTRDLDLLGYGDSSQSGLLACFQNLCTLDVEPDGLIFDAESISIQDIRENQSYEGQRIQLTIFLGKAKVLLQVDIGFGDAVTPSPSQMDYPTLLNFGAPRLRMYPRETVIAEKLQAMIVLGMTNSRMKDFYDIWTLACLFEFDGDILAEAIQQTFARRQTSIPKQLPIALTIEFGEHPDKRRQWQIFSRKSVQEPVSLNDVIVKLREFIAPVLNVAAMNAPSSFYWQAGGPWIFEK